MLRETCVRNVGYAFLQAVASFLSKSFPGIYVAIQTFLSFFQGPVFSILLLGMFWPRATQWGGLAGLVGASQGDEHTYARIIFAPYGISWCMVTARAVPQPML